MKRILFALVVACFTFFCCEKKSANVVETAENIVEEDVPDSAQNDAVSAEPCIEEPEQTKAEEISETEECDDAEIKSEDTGVNDYEIITLKSPIMHFVSTDDGSSLNYRAEPVVGEKLGSFPNGTKLEVTKRTDRRFEIDGIKEVWLYAVNMEDVPPSEGWVFGGYLSCFDPKKNYLKKDEIEEEYLIGEWEDEGHSVYIKSDGRFFFGLKESEGFGGNWSIRWDGTLYVADCQVYDEEPSSAEYKIKVCDSYRLVLVNWAGWEYDMHPVK